MPSLNNQRAASKLVCATAAPFVFIVVSSHLPEGVLLSLTTFCHFSPANEIQQRPEADRGCGICGPAVGRRSFG